MTKATLSSLVGKDTGKMTPLNITGKKTLLYVNKLYGQASGLAKVADGKYGSSQADKMIAKSNSAKLPQVNLVRYAAKTMVKILVSSEFGE